MTVPTTRMERATWLADEGGLDAALDGHEFAEPLRLPLTEALVLGLLRQGVSKYLVIFGHGSTELGETLRVYEAAGLVRCYQFRNEVEMSHAGTALRLIYDEPCAVVTSIGPGALQAMAGSLAAASNGVGIYHLYGDETTHGEGYNMQQIPRPEQGLFGRLTAAMGGSYTLYAPGAVRDALRKGAATVFHPTKAGPFLSESAAERAACRSPCPVGCPSEAPIVFTAGTSGRCSCRPGGGLDLQLPARRGEGWRWQLGRGPPASQVCRSGRCCCRAFAGNHRGSAR